jgi:hypothetical protein
MHLLRGTPFPMSELGTRLKCPSCGSRRVALIFNAPREHADRTRESEVVMDVKKERAALWRVANSLDMIIRRCQLCRSKPAHAGEVHFRGNVGMFVARQEHELKAELCTPCLHKQFARFTLMNLFFGWWGIVSMIVNPGYILGNIAQYELALRAARAYRKKIDKNIDDTIRKALESRQDATGT